MKDTKVLHLHAQESFHGDAFIVANRVALEQLKVLIDAALEKGKADEIFFVQDGEGFALYVVLDDSDRRSKTWKNRILPYTDKDAYWLYEIRTMKPWDDILLADHNVDEWLDALKCTECSSEVIDKNDPQWTTEHRCKLRTLSCKCENGHEFTLIEAVFDHTPDTSFYAKPAKGES